MPPVVNSFVDWVDQLKPVHWLIMAFLGFAMAAAAAGMQWADLKSEVKDIRLHGSDPLQSLEDKVDSHRAEHELEFKAIERSLGKIEGALGIKQ